MPDLSILNIAVSLAFTYLLLAIIVSSISEWLLNSVLNLRAKDLKSSIENMLFDPQWKNIAADILSSPFISSLKKSSEKFPSYIPAKNFASAFIDAIKEGTRSPEILENFDMISLKKLLFENKLAGSDVQKVVAGLIEKSEGSMEKFHINLELFFDDAMNRANGWYKRKAKRAAFIISVVICITLNVDTIRISKTLWEQPQLAETAAVIASRHIADIDTAGGQFAIKGTRVSLTDTTIKKSSPSGDTTVIISNKSIKNTIDANSLFGQLHLPIGWIAGNIPGTVNGEFDLLGWISKLIGLLLTAGAVSLGAPFWFDIANKFINIRSSGTRPESENQNGKKDIK